jgi:hypothetical protein
MSVQEYLPYELTDLTIRKFAAAGVGDAERDRWLAAGFGPYAALNHIGIGVTLEAAMLARQVGLGSGRLRELAERGQGIDEYLDHAVEVEHLDLDQLRALHERRFELVSVARARRAGFLLDDLMLHTPETIFRLEPLFELGLSRDEVLRWAARSLDVRLAFEGCQFDDDPDAAVPVSSPRLADAIRALLDELRIDRTDLLSLLATGYEVEEIREAVLAGATVELLGAVPWGDGSEGRTRELRHLALVSVLRRGVPAGVIVGWIREGLSLDTVLVAVLRGASIEEAPWLALFPDGDRREQWQRTGLSASECVRWSRYGLEPGQLLHGVPIEEVRLQVSLIGKLLGVGLDSDSDYPCEVQGESVVDGVIEVVRREACDGHLTGRVTRSIMGLEELLRAAAGYGVRDFTLR